MTAQPIADKQNLEIRIYNPSRLADLKEQLLADRRSALVVGHSNTTPELAALLSARPVDPMDETVYDLMYVVSFSASGAELIILDQRAMP